MSIKYHILFRACDKVESVHKVRRPFGLNKVQTIKLCFYSMYQALQNEEFQFTINRNTFKNEQIDYEGFLLISLSLSQFNNDNIGLYKNNREKVFSWSFDKTIKPKIALHLDQNGNILVYNDTHVSLISNKSNEIWRSKKVIHHWGTVFEGKLFIPGRKYLNYPEDLDEKSLIKILVEPKNSLIKQYKELFKLEGVKLTFKDAAIKEIAQKGIKKKTGARGLRSILENILLKTMFDLPSQENVEEIIIDTGAVKGQNDPLIIHSKKAKSKEEKISAA